MIICQNCGIPMVRTVSFEKEVKEKFFRCPHCYVETKHVKIKDSDLCFGEKVYSK